MKENQKNGRRMDGRETEEKIIKCAGQLIAEKGFASVTSKEICRAAGVNLAAVNYHFGSRDGLYLAVLENVQQYLVGLQQLIDLRALLGSLGQAAPRASSRELREALDAARRALESGTPAADVAVHTGYADQAHLSREVRAFLGYSPSAYLARRRGEFTPV